MARAAVSGYRLNSADAAIVKGMQSRGDRDHDIAAWFGVNQGRVADVKEGHKFPSVPVAPNGQLPPSGPPGIKGRRLRTSLDSVLKHLQGGKSDAALNALQEALKRYDTNEM